MSNQEERLLIKEFERRFKLLVAETFADKPSIEKIQDRTAEVASAFLKLEKYWKEGE